MFFPGKTRDFEVEKNLEVKISGCEKQFNFKSLGAETSHRSFPIALVIQNYQSVGTFFPSIWLFYTRDGVFVASCFG